MNVLPVGFPTTGGSPDVDGGMALWLLLAIGVLAIAASVATLVVARKR